MSLPREFSNDYDDGTKMIEKEKEREREREVVEILGGEERPLTAERRGNVWRQDTVCVRWLRACVCFLRKMSALPVAFDD